MNRRRARLIVEVDLDPVPGWGNDPNDWVELLTLKMAEHWYHPTVRLDCVIDPAPVPTQPEDSSEGADGV